MNCVLIIEDDAKSRIWLADIVREVFPGCSVYEVSSVQEGLTATTCKPDLALIDLGLPDGSGMEVLRRIHQIKPDAVCVVVTMMADDACIVGALSAGANGYLLKEQSAEHVKQQLLQLSEGLPALSPTIARRIMEHFRLTGPASHCDADLSEREKQVLALIARGLRNSEVGEALSIAGSTVATHIKSIYHKLGISTRAEASWHAARFGL